jgi:hypothetical protein
VLLTICLCLPAFTDLWYAAPQSRLCCASMPSPRTSGQGIIHAVQSGPSYKASQTKLWSHRKTLPALTPQLCACNLEEDSSTKGTAKYTVRRNTLHSVDTAAEHNSYVATLPSCPPPKDHIHCPLHVHLMLTAFSMFHPSNIPAPPKLCNTD